MRRALFLELERDRWLIAMGHCSHTHERASEPGNPKVALDGKADLR